MLIVMNTGKRRDGSRKQVATDAAIEVIAEAGLRGLTHRAVDATAGLPPGSASSCFRTRLDLLAAVLARLVELDEETIAHLPSTGWTTGTPDGREHIEEMLAQLLRYRLGPARQQTIARLEIYLDAARHPDLLPKCEAANRRFVERMAEAMRSMGIADPEDAARILLAQLDGILYDAVARPFLGGEEERQLRRAVRTIVRGHIE